jgi:hypothetical protein
MVMAITRDGEPVAVIEDSLDGPRIIPAIVFDVNGAVLLGEELLVLQGMHNSLEADDGEGNPDIVLRNDDNEEGVWFFTYPVILDATPEDVVELLRFLRHRSFVEGIPLVVGKSWV